MKRPGFRTVAVELPTYRTISKIANEEGRSLFGTVRIAIQLYDEYRKQAEDVLDGMELTPRKK